MKSSLGGIHLEGTGLVERGNPTGLVELVAWFGSSLYFSMNLKIANGLWKISSCIALCLADQIAHNAITVVTS
jgi:hypothetical protein